MNYYFIDSRCMIFENDTIVIATNDENAYCRGEVFMIYEMQPLEVSVNE